MDMENEQIEAREGEWLALSPGPGQGAPPATLPEGEARLRALVLEARHIPCRIEPDDAGWRLLVPAPYFARAREELRLFEEENRNWPPPEPPARPLVENTLAALSVLILLATFHNLTLLDASLFGHPPIDWVLLGKAHAARIMNGEWWRLVTALTLHADWLHLFGNLALGGIFIVSLCRELGSGLAWSLLLGAGILGNLANAWLHPPDHSSVGASTLVFGAVGILAALNLIRNRHNRKRRWPLPVAAALALLALLGTEGEHTDLGAHLFGFLSGTGLGLATEWLIGRHGRPGRRVNALLALASAVLVVAAWWGAVVAGG
ncbi:MAG: rhomboid family intramembrane serine protease [Geobacteraceae bacterium]|nr:rhomboid family intramembrane serine protease [Geobacteraceae bacterium]